MRFKSLILRAPDKRCKQLEYMLFYWQKVLIYQGLKIDCVNDEIGEASDVAIFCIKVLIFCLIGLMGSISSIG